MKKQECVVRIPGINEKKRFMVPDNMLLGEGIHLMLELIKEDYEECSCEEEKLNLFKAATGEILMKDQCLKEVGITESDELILG